MPTDSTKTFLETFAGSWLIAPSVIALAALIFAIVKYKKLRHATKPHFSDPKINLGSPDSTFSFKITNHRTYSISLRKTYYRILYLGFFPSFKIKFYNHWFSKKNVTNIEKEEEFIIPLANSEIILKYKCKIYARTTDGLCSGTHTPTVHNLTERLLKETKSKKQ